MSNIIKNGCIIRVKPDKLEKYISLHDTQPNSIRNLMKSYGFVKCEIFLKEINGEKYLFQYNEIDSNMNNEEIYKNEEYKEWLRITGECQLPLEGHSFWEDILQVYSL